MSSSSHLRFEHLVAIMDNEVSAAERLKMQAHMEACLECKREWRALTTVSRELDVMLTPPVAVDSEQARAALLARLNTATNEAGQERPSWSKRLVKTGWVGRGLIAALAASLVLFVWLRLESAGNLARSVTPAPVPAASEFLEVDGESFLRLPYSNADLPIGVPRILRMQVPIASLAQTGLLFAPDSGTALGDRAVLADVLLGLDGEPLGVHLLEE